MRLPTKAPAMTGGQLQEQIIELAHLLGWKVAHFRPARTKFGWRTPVAADGKGYPDLVLYRERIVHVECKSRHEPLRAEQVSWRDWVLKTGGEHYVWRPSDWPEIERVLRRQTTPVSAQAGHKSQARAVSDEDQSGGE